MLIAWQVYLYVHVATCAAFQLPFLYLGTSIYDPMQARALHSGLGRFIVAYVAVHDFVSSPLSTTSTPSVQDASAASAGGATALAVHPLVAVATILCFFFGQLDAIDTFALFCWLLSIAHLWAIRTGDELVPRMMQSSPRLLRVNLFPAVAPFLSVSSLWWEGICGSYLTFAVWRLTSTYRMGDVVVEGTKIRLRISSWPYFFFTTSITTVPIALTSALCCDPWRTFYAFQRFLLNWLVLGVVYLLIPYLHAALAAAAGAARRGAAPAIAVAVLAVVATAAFDYGVSTLGLDALRAAGVEV